MIPISAILFACATICKAFADTVDHHFDTSIFKRLNPKFWDRDISSDRAKKVFGYKVDAWHLGMSAMIVLCALTAIFHRQTLSWYWELLIAGGIWNIVFNLFYNRLFRKRK